MSKVVRLVRAEDSSRQACTWIAKLDAGPLSEEDITSLELWLTERKSNAALLVEVAELLDDMSVLSQLSDVIPIRMLAEPTESRNTSLPELRFFYSPQITGLLAGILLLVFIGFQQFRAADEIDILTAKTDIGEYKTVTLQDGSQAIVNTDSEITTNFDDNLRAVKLVKGEAHFDVVADKTRPFIVYAGNTAIRAVGTAFNVRAWGESVEVIVTEGVVDVFPKDEVNSVYQPEAVVEKSGIPSASATSVEAGQSTIIISQVGALKSLDPRSIEKKLAWQNGMLVFEGDPLEKVVEEISRYTTMTFIISDEQTRNIKVGGYFETGDIDKLLDVLEHGFKIAVTKSDSGTVFLTQMNLSKDE